MSDLQRLEAARLKIAAYLAVDPAYGPTFDRLEREIAIEKADIARTAKARLILTRAADLRLLA